MRAIFWRLRAAIGLLSLVGVAAPVAKAGPVLRELAVTPSQAAPGAVEFVHGHGIAPFAAVNLNLGRLPGGEGDCRNMRAVLSLGTAFAGAAGQIDASFVLPGQVDGATSLPGVYCVLGLYAPGVYVYDYLRVAMAGPANGPGCYFVLGFAVLRALIPGPVGSCLEDEQHNPSTGDGLQQTTGGLLVWRKADDWTAFTDGNRTWVNGPYGLQTRLNSEHFLWEGADSGAGATLVAPIAAATLIHYYALIDRRDFAAAYALWQAPVQSYSNFAAGFSATESTAIRLGMATPDSAAGHLGVDFSAVVIARQMNGGVQAFGGCYVLAALEPRLMAPAAPRPFRIRTAHVRPMPGVITFSDPAARAALAARC